MTITGSAITDNTANVGGGIINDGGSMAISDTTVSGNSATSWAGGGILNDARGTMTVTNIVATGNSASDGAGITNRATLEIAYTTVSGNTGGGVANFGAGILEIRDSTVSDNTGPGILNGNVVTIRNTTISGNTADYGGAIAGGGTVTLENCTLSDNTAASHGGGAIHMWESTISMTNCTVSGNTGEPGAAILNAKGTITLKNTIIANNSGPSCSGNPFGLGASNLTDDTTCTAAAGFTFVTNVGLGPLADNGGPTHTHALLAGNPAVDAGVDSICPDIDQRGVSRPQDGDGDGSARCDIGAFELSP